LNTSTDYPRMSRGGPADAIFSRQAGVGVLWRSGYVSISTAGRTACNFHSPTALGGAPVFANRDGAAHPLPAHFAA
jgi:hypothetical protein